MVLRTTNGNGVDNGVINDTTIMAYNDGNTTTPNEEVIIDEKTNTPNEVIIDKNLDRNKMNGNNR